MGFGVSSHSDSCNPLQIRIWFVYKQNKNDKIRICINKRVICVKMKVLFFFCFEVTEMSILCRLCSFAGEERVLIYWQYHYSKNDMIVSAIEIVQLILTDKEWNDSKTNRKLFSKTTHCSILIPILLHWEKITITFVECVLSSRVENKPEMAKQNTQLHIDLVYGYNQNRTEQNENTWTATLSLSLWIDTMHTHVNHPLNCDDTLQLVTLKE